MTCEGCGAPPTGLTYKTGECAYCGRFEKRPGRTDRLAQMYGLGGLQQAQHYQQNLLNQLGASSNRQVICHDRHRAAQGQQNASVMNSQYRAAQAQQNALLVGILSSGAAWWRM